MSLNRKEKSLQKVFENNDFIYELVQNSKNLVLDLSSIFSYYLCTEDKNRKYTIQEINSKLIELQTSGNDIIEERYYFQAYNGGCDKSYKKNGLDDISSIPKKVVESFAFLEKELGKTDKILGGYDGKKNRSFITGDPKLVIKYALNYAPERLWAGPFCETGYYIHPLKTPIKIGESKTQYMMRIIANKIEKLDVSSEKKEAILKAGKIVSEFYGCKRPRIAIIPEHMIKDKMASFGDDNPNKTLEELAKKEQDMWKRTLQSGPNFAYEMGVVIFDKILPNQFRSISIPDQFELMQIKAIQRGAEIGDLINPYTGKLVERRKNVELDVVRPKNPVLEFIKKVTEKKQKAVMPKTYKNNGKIDLGGTGQMYLCIDEQDKEYLFKPALRKNTNIYEPFRANIQIIASKLQNIISPETSVECTHAFIDNQKGTIQPKIEIDKAKMKMLEEYYLNDGPIDEKNARQFMREFVVDYCLCNYDSHYKNFIIDKDGNLRGIDKEQSLKYLFYNEKNKENDTRSHKFFGEYDYFMKKNPNKVYGELPPIYSKIFKDIENGKIPGSVLQELRLAIQSLEKIPANEYLDMFTPYVQSLNLDKESEINYYNRIMDRRQCLKTNVLREVNTIDTSVDEKRKKVQKLSRILSQLRGNLSLEKGYQNKKSIEKEH